MAFGFEPFDLYGVSPGSCCWIESGGVMVVGAIGQGTSMSLTSDWSQPLADANLGSMPGMEKIAAVAQIGKPGSSEGGMTSITTYSTTQVWNGTKPVTFNLTLDFFAISDAKTQVMMAVQKLLEMASPNVEAISPFDYESITGDKPAAGRIPHPVSINIGRRIIVPQCVIESISVPIDKERDKDGNLMRAQVTLGVQTKVMLNADVVGGLFK